MTVSSEEVTEQIHTSAESALQALGAADFYIELTYLAAAFLAAFAISTLLGLLLKRSLKKAPEDSKLKALDWSAPMKLVLPLLTVTSFAVTMPLAQSAVASLQIFEPAIEIASAWLMVQAAFLIISSKFVAWFTATIICIGVALSATGFLQITQAYLDGIGFVLGDYNITLLGFLQGLIMFVIVFWLAGTISRTTDSYLRRTSSLSFNARELISKLLTVFFYFIAALITMDAVGIDLTALAVLGGAVGVGVGFGLQKITSNFVSGITILMEKSIKIGDLVEIGNEMGWIRQLKMRYSLIETFDGREVMIPNETLITNNVTNWTYSNTLGRVEVHIGVSYDSDLELVQKLILDAALENPSCIKDGDNEPACYLREFGDNSVNFMLLFWVPDVREGRYGPQSDVMFAIWNKFKEHNIEIPFPQRVLHVDWEKASKELSAHRAHA